MPISIDICQSIYPGQAIIAGNQSGLPALTSASPFGILGNNWLTLSVLALATSLLMLVLVYIFANFLRNTALLTWTKFELFQIFGTAVIVLFTATAIVGGMCTFDMSFLGSGRTPNPYIGSDGHPMNMYQIAGDYFNRAEGLGNTVFAYLLWTIKMVNYLAKINWTSHPLGVGSADNPLDSLTQINTLFFYMVSAYVVSYLLLQMQMRMLEYLAVACLYYFFPFGIFFRSFEPTRVFGGVLIGLSISFFLFYPIIMSFNHYLMTRETFENVNGIKVAMGSLMANAVNEVGPALGKADDASNSTSPIRDPSALANNGSELGDTATQDSLVDGISGGVLFIFKPLMLYIIVAVVLPVINFIVLVEITKGVTKLFGEEVDVSNLTRLI